MIPTILGVMFIVFVLMRVIPGDAVEMRYTEEGTFVSKEMLVQERARLGLDQPIWRQFVKWIWGIARLDFGISMWTGRPITHEIKIRLELSLQVALMATFFATLIAIPLGTMAAIKQDTWVDYVIRIFSIAGLATPSFWLGILMILMLLIYFKWLQCSLPLFGKTRGRTSHS
jgi:peptide/nickel transport system permease protein